MTSFYSALIGSKKEMEGEIEKEISLGKTSSKDKQSIVKISLALEDVGSTRHDKQWKHSVNLSGYDACGNAPDCYGNSSVDSQAYCPYDPSGDKLGPYTCASSVTKIQWCNENCLSLGIFPVLDGQKLWKHVMTFLRKACLRSYKIHKGGGCECIYQGGQFLGRRLLMRSQSRDVIVLYMMLHYCWYSVSLLSYLDAFRLPSYFYLDFPLSDRGRLAVKVCQVELMPVCKWSEANMQICLLIADGTWWRTVTWAWTCMDFLVTCSLCDATCCPRSLIPIYGTTCAAWDQFPETPGFQHCPPGTVPHLHVSTGFEQKTYDMSWYVGVCPTGLQELPTYLHRY